MSDTTTTTTTRTVRVLYRCACELVRRRVYSVTRTTTRGCYLGRMWTRPGRAAWKDEAGALAGDGDRAPSIACSCGRRVLGEPVRGTMNKRIPCDARCTNAVGPACSCSCGGANHGGGHGA